MHAIQEFLGKVKVLLIFLFVTIILLWIFWKIFGKNFEMTLLKYDTSRYDDGTTTVVNITSSSTKKKPLLPAPGSLKLKPAGEPTFITPYEDVKFQDATPGEVPDIKVAN